MIRSDVILIGGGPAGLTAAIQLKRYGIQPLLFEAERLGGLLWNANLVENYPGFPEGIPGPALVAQFTAQFHRLGLQAISETALHLDLAPAGIRVQTSGQEYLARVVVIASGTRPRRFPDGLVPPEAEKRVFYEVVPLLALVEKQVAVVGAGDAAFDYALNLARRDNEVHILNRGGEVKALPLLQERVAKNALIHYHPGTSLNAVTDLKRFLELSITSPDLPGTLSVDHLIGALGREPNLPGFSAAFEKDLPALIAAGRVHLVGDVANGIYRQTAIAVGNGLQAAMKIFAHLKE